MRVAATGLQSEPGFPRHNAAEPRQEVGADDDPNPGRRQNALSCGGLPPLLRLAPHDLVRHPEARDGERERDGGAEEDGSQGADLACADGGLREDLADAPTEAGEEGAET